MGKLGKNDKDRLGFIRYKKGKKEKPADVTGLTEREVILYRCALTWFKRYKDSNPDYGMGPSERMLLEQLIIQTKIKVTEEDKKRIVYDPIFF